MIDPTGYHLSEKLDGCRAFWGDGWLSSRQGRDFKPPAWFLAGMPDGVRLDGELYMGRGTFPALVSAIQRKRDPWAGVEFHIFDLAHPDMIIDDRHAVLAALPLPPHCHLVPHRICTGQADLDAAERAIVDGGGEGIMLRSPRSKYRPADVVKIKRLYPDLNRAVLD